MNILFIGDIYGRTGRTLVTRELPALRKKLACDWVIANAENVSGGVGLSPGHFKELRRAGVDVCTMGNHLFARRDWPDLVKDERVLRPHNLGGDELPGKGWGKYELPGGEMIGIINVAGRVFMEPAECPFRWVDRLLERMPAGTPVVCDFHAEATSEKIALATYLDKRVALLVGTHTHVQTADERIFPGGMGYMTDVGLTGPRDGVIGVRSDIVIQRFVKGYSDRFEMADGPGQISALLADIGRDGICRRLERISLPGSV